MSDFVAGPDGRSVKVRFTPGLPGPFDGPCIFLLEDGSIHEGVVIASTPTFKSGALSTTNTVGGFHEKLEIPVHRVVGWADAGRCGGRAQSLEKCTSKGEPSTLESRDEALVNPGQIRQEYWRLSLPLLAIAWTILMGVTCYQDWPSKELKGQEPAPKLPTLEECLPRDFLDCFGAVVRHRETLAYEREEYAENYEKRVVFQLGKSVFLWGVPLLVLAVFRSGKRH